MTPGVEPPMLLCPFLERRSAYLLCKSSCNRVFSVLGQDGVSSRGQRQVALFT